MVSLINDTIFYIIVENEHNRMLIKRWIIEWTYSVKLIVMMNKISP